MVDYSALGKRIRFRRRRLKLSQQDMARAVQISASYYGNIERGLRIPSIDTLVAIANALNVGVDFLLAESLTAPHVQRDKNDLKVLTQYLRDQIAELDYSGVMEENGEKDQ